MKKTPLKFRLIFILGILCSPISLMINRYYSLPDPILGFIQGVGIGLLLIFLVCGIRNKKFMGRNGIS